MLPANKIRCNTRQEVSDNYWTYVRFHKILADKDILASPMRLDNPKKASRLGKTPKQEEIGMHKR
jgi:hypothetical protein